MMNISSRNDAINKPAEDGNDASKIELIRFDESVPLRHRREDNVKEDPSKLEERFFADVHDKKHTQGKSSSTTIIKAVLPIKIVAVVLHAVIAAELFWLFRPSASSLPKMCTADNQLCVPEKSWRDFDYSDFWRFTKCPKVLRSPRPIPDDETWGLLRSIYSNVIDEDCTNVTEPFEVAYSVRQVPRKGRGIFAEQFIPGGSLVWKDSARFTFSNAQLYRRFLATIPATLRCDVMMWSNVENWGTQEKPDYTLVTDLNDGAMINQAQRRRNLNVGCNETAAKRYNDELCDNVYSLRDIQPGEELLMDYGYYSYPWSKVGI